MYNSSNLVYNGDFALGNKGWSSSISVADGVATLPAVQGKISSVEIPVYGDDQFQVEFDVMNTTTDTRTFYCAMWAFDRTGNHVGVNTIQRSPSGDTTLTQELKNGDTVVHVASTSGWYTSQTYRYVGICDSPAWNYSRVLYEQKYDSSSVQPTQVTLQSAWAGGTWKAGTRVGCFTDGSTFIYPWYMASLPQNQWVHASGVFRPSGNRPSLVGMYFGVISYVAGYKIKNVKITNITRPQFFEVPTKKSGLFTLQNPNISKAGVSSQECVKEGTVQARYVRDWCIGSSANSDSHWCEIDVYNEYGDIISNGCSITFGEGKVRGNVIYNHDVSPYDIGNSENTNFIVGHLITDGNSASMPYVYTWSAENQRYAHVDLGKLYNISKIKHWHYWKDGRTYHNTKIEVSADGTNWTTLFDSAVSGEYAETSEGHTVDA